MTENDADAHLKHLLPDPVLRIELRDFVIRVVEKAAKELTAEAFSAARPEPTDDTVRARVAMYDRTIEPIARLLVVGCYYSDVAEHHRFWTDAVEQLWSTAASDGHESDPRYTVWTQLRRYPALAALYACALGSLAGHHPEALAALLAQLAEVGNGQLGEPLLEQLTLDAVGFAGGSQFRDAKTPQSEFMLDRLRKWSGGVVRDAALEDVFD